MKCFATAMIVGAVALVSACSKGPSHDGAGQADLARANEHDAECLTAVLESMNYLNEKGTQGAAGYYTGRLEGRNAGRHAAQFVTTAAARLPKATEDRLRVAASCIQDFAQSADENSRLVVLERRPENPAHEQ